MKSHLGGIAVFIGSLIGTTVIAHPLDGLSGEEYQKITSVLKAEGVADDDTLYPEITLLEPAKADILDWKEGDSVDRRATVYMTDGDGGFNEAVVNLTQESVENIAPAQGQPMVMLANFLDAMEGALGAPDMIAGLEARGLSPDQLFCLPLTAGNFFTPEYENSRLMKVPCYLLPEGSNFYAKPVEGLFAFYDIGKKEIISVTDTGEVPIASDPWGYTEEEIAERQPLRPKTNPVHLRQEGGPNYTIEGSNIQWDIWRFHYRVDKRPGLVVSNIDVNDQGTWRSVLYQAHLSEVFVPYMDPSEGWYWRTYMDSGEYGFGQFLSPLARGIDCPDYATFLSVAAADDLGNPIEIPDAICLFERNIGDPAWRHFEIFAQSETDFVPAEGRPNTELVMRTASEVGNYDYLIDYRFYQNGDLKIMIGSTGIDAVKGVASTSMSDETAAADTRYGTLIAPNLVAPNHDHYFNFRLDFDIDQPINQFATMDLVPGQIDSTSPRRSLWTVEHNLPDSEMDARYRISSAEPKYFHYSNPNRKGYLDHNPGYMIHHGSVAYGPFDFSNDPPMKRNGYIEYSVWNTVYDPMQRYAGGKYALQGDGSDSLPVWAADDESLAGKDVVSWFSAGFHHIARLEDWPIMSTDWKTVHLMPHNFFANNPAMTLRKEP